MTQAAPKAQNAQKQQIYKIGFFALALALIPLASVAPKAMAYAPALLGLCGLLLGRFVFGSKLSVAPVALKLIFPIVVLVALSCLWSVQPDFSIQRTLRAGFILLSGLLFLSVLRMMDLTLLKSYLWLLPVCTSLAIGINIVEMYFEMPLHRFIRGIGNGELSQAVTNRAVFCSIAVSFLSSAVIWKHEKFRAYRLYWLGAFNGLVVLMLCLSLGQSSHLAFGLAALVCFAFPYGRQKAWLVLTVLICALLLMAPWIAQAMFKHLAVLVNDVEWFRNGYAAHRMEIWDFISRYISNAPILGHGIESTRYIQDFDSQTLYHNSNKIMHPHNFALQIWIEFGLIGIVGACAFFAALFQQFQKLDIFGARIALSTSFVFISVGATGYGLWQSWWLGEILFVTGLAVLVMRSLGSEVAAKE